MSGIPWLEEEREKALSFNPAKARVVIDIPRLLALIAIAEAAEGWDKSGKDEVEPLLDTLRKAEATP